MQQPDQLPPQAEQTAHQQTAWIGRAAVPTVEYRDSGWEPTDPGFSPHDWHTDYQPGTQHAADARPVTTGQVLSPSGVSPERELTPGERMQAMDEQALAERRVTLRPNQLVPVKRSNGTEEIWTVEKIGLDGNGWLAAVVVPLGGGAEKIMSIDQATAANARYNQRFAP